MKKTKTQKGITLVALIITIIVLLILAVVAIRAVTGDGILGKAKEGTTQYTESKIKEEIKMLQYEEILAIANGQTYDLLTKIQAKEWCESATKNEDKSITVVITGGKNLLVTNTEIINVKTLADYGVKIGDYVNYNEGTSGKHTPDPKKGYGTSKTGGSNLKGYTLGTREIKQTDSGNNLTWRVLGVNHKGELELISGNPTGTTLYIANDTGYNNVKNNLNNFCNDLYGHGEHAVGARSLKIEDINKLANFNPRTDSNGYGKKRVYKFSDVSTKVQFSDDDEVTWRDTSFKKFRLPNETTAISSSNPGSREITISDYNYYIIDKIRNVEILNMLTRGEGSSVISQWLASQAVGKGNGEGWFEVGYLKGDEHASQYGNPNDIINYSTAGFSVVYQGSETLNYWYAKARPVVSISPDIKLDGGEDSTHTTVATAWEIK